MGVICILLTISFAISANAQSTNSSCASSPCENRGLCLDTLNGYTCTCAKGFMGSNCQTEIDECASTPCKNGASCFDQLNSFACLCLPGFTGDECETNIDDCIPSPCLNNGHCIDGVNSYTCNCSYGYIGDHCETRTDVDDCYSNPCLNGGSCFDGNFTYTCQCTDHYKGPNCQTPCRDVKADIVMVLDSSGSVGSSNFQKLKDFTKNVAKSFDIGPSAVHMSVITYSSNVHNQFFLDQYQDNSSLLHAIDAIHYTSGGTNTGGALGYALHNTFTSAHGDRPDAANIVVVITDGKSADAKVTQLEAELLHQAGITTVAIGIGNSANSHELDILASKHSLMFRVPSYTALHSIQGLLDHGICKAHLMHTTVFPTPPNIMPVNCEDKITNCYQYGVSACSNYRQWASDNCPKYCQFCQAPSTEIPTLGPLIIG